MFGLVELMILGIIGLVVILPFWRIFSRAGFSGWFSLGMVIPGLNFIALFYLAFAEWPIQRELDSLKSRTPGAVGNATGTLSCPECSTPYNPADYRPDAKVIFCSTCKAELPRPQVI